jgi:hypothetical protein
MTIEEMKQAIARAHVNVIKAQIESLNAQDYVIAFKRYLKNP